MVGVRGRDPSRPYRTLTARLEELDAWAAGGGAPPSKPHVRTWPPAPSLAPSPKRGASHPRLGRGARCWPAARRCPRSRSSPTTSTSWRWRSSRWGSSWAGSPTCTGPAARSATAPSAPPGSCSAPWATPCRWRSWWAGVLILMRELRPPARPLRTGLVCLVAALTLVLAAGTLGLGPGAAPAAQFWHAAAFETPRRRRGSGRVLGDVAPALDARRRHPGGVPVRRRADPGQRRHPGHGGPRHRRRRGRHRPGGPPLHRQRLSDPRRATPGHHGRRRSIPRAVAHGDRCARRADHRRPPARPRPARPRPGTGAAAAARAGHGGADRPRHPRRGAAQRQPVRRRRSGAAACSIPTAPAGRARSRPPTSAPSPTPTPRGPPAPSRPRRPDPAGPLPRGRSPTIPTSSGSVPNTRFLVRSTGEAAKPDTAGQEQVARTLLETLGHFGIDAKVIGRVTGPHITRYEIRLAPGIKVAKVAQLKDDLAYALAATDIRILAPDPGQAGGRRRGPQRAAQDRPPRRRLPGPAARLVAADGVAGQGHRRARHRRRPGQDAAPAGGRDHRRRQVRVRQRDAVEHPAARDPPRGADRAGRSQAGRAQPLRVDPAPAHPGDHQPPDGRQRAAEPGQGDGAALRDHVAGPDPEPAGAQPRARQARRAPAALHPVRHRRARRPDDGRAGRRRGLDHPPGPEGARGRASTSCWPPSRPAWT